MAQYYEELLDENKSRLSIHPIEYHDIFEMYRKMSASHWTAYEIDFSTDYDDFLKLNDDEQYFISMVLAFFSQSDGIVNKNIEERFINDIKIMEAKFVYNYQKMMEDTHNLTYSIQIDTIIKDPHKKSIILNATHNYLCIKNKADWASKWITSDDIFAKRLIAFAIVEGLFFSGSFCAIFWLKKRNLMPGLCISNEFISRDEGMHTDYACLLYSKLNNKLSFDEIKDMFIDAVKVEMEFICNTLPCSLLGMNSKLMCQYIQYVADRLLLQLGYEKIWKVDNPFDFMESISVDVKANFFEHTPTTYQNASTFNVNREYKELLDF